MWGAWIEIQHGYNVYAAAAVAPHAGAGIEILEGLWIQHWFLVAPHAGGVD